MSKLKDIVFDCPKPSALARFWEQVLEGYSILPYDDEEIARLAARGLTPETDYSVIMVGPGPRVCFQQVPPSIMKVTGGRRSSIPRATSSA
jgi:hypothetical protein